MYNSTSTPEPVGECPRCGKQCFKGIQHFCPTVPRFTSILKSDGTHEAILDRKGE